MTAVARSERLIQRLVEELQALPGLKRAADLEDLWADPGSAAYLVRPKLSMANHFEPKPEVVLQDPRLGTLGFVEVVLPPDKKVNIQEDVEKRVTRHVNDATYARHLLVRDRNLEPRRASTVELVFLTARKTPEEEQTVEAIGTALQKILRTTDSLTHIGIGVLVENGDDEEFRYGVRRAFPWLLCATRRWLELPGKTARPAPLPATPPNGLRRLERVKLVDYRMPGSREIRLASSTVHLVHGQNGSGKTSLVEALELATTGGVERIAAALAPEPVPSYDRIVRNRRANDKARIELGWRDKEKPLTELTVEDSGVSSPLDPEVPAGSFRLDQPLMDRLIGVSSHARARTYLQAFFPEAQKSLSDYEHVGEERRKALQSLEPLILELTAAKKVLERLGTWRTGSSVRPSEDFHELLNQWLEKTALCDLAQRECGVRKTFEDAARENWAPAAEFQGVWLQPRGVPGSPSVSWLEERIGLLTEEVAELQQKLSFFSHSPHGAASGVGSPSIPELSASETETLDHVGRWLLPDDALGIPLGEKIFRVLRSHEAPTIGSIVIGAENWASPLTKDLEALLGACREVAGDRPAPDWPGKTGHPDYDAARLVQQQFLAAAKALTEAFEQRLSPCGVQGPFDGSLISAVNELMALFTPARWSYDDLRLPSQLGNGRLAIGLEIGQGNGAARAELLLNTAELNLYTVALFLLCATRVQKPLGLLLFDDPLQNMDELTSVALARGLTKFVRLWRSMGREEELMLLFHGSDDLERFRMEMPASVYNLPWLSPLPKETTPPTEAAQGPAPNLASQDLKPFFTART